MSMRSTKDLKDIVSGFRAKTKMNGIAGDASTDDSLWDNEKENEESKQNMYGKESVDALKQEISDLQRKMG